MTQEQNNSDKSLLSNLKSGDKYFTILKVLGKGSYGTVYKGIHNSTEAQVAIKIIEVRRKHLNQLLKEIDILIKYSGNENIALFYGLFCGKRDLVDNPKVNIWIVLEFCDGGTLSNLIYRHNVVGSHIKESWCVYFLREILYGLKFLHSNGVIHRDIKSQNVMLTQNGGVKLVDFGVSTQISITCGKTRTMVGTPFWIAPEVILCEKNSTSSYNSKCDIWSVGILAIELKNFTPPHSKVDPKCVLSVILQSPSPKLASSSDGSKYYHDFIALALDKNYKTRPDASTLLEHKVFKKYILKMGNIKIEISAFLQAKKVKDIKRSVDSNINKISKIADSISNESGICVRKSFTSIMQRIGSVSNVENRFLRHFTNDDKIQGFASKIKNFLKNGKGHNFISSKKEIKKPSTELSEIKNSDFEKSDDLNKDNFVNPEPYDIISFDEFTSEVLTLNNATNITCFDLYESNIYIGTKNGIVLSNLEKKQTCSIMETYVIYNLLSCDKGKRIAILFSDQHSTERLFNIVTVIKGDNTFISSSDNIVYDLPEAVRKMGKISSFESENSSYIAVSNEKKIYVLRKNSNNLNQFILSMKIPLPSIELRQLHINKLKQNVAIFLVSDSMTLFNMAPSVKFRILLEYSTKKDVVYSSFVFKNKEGELKIVICLENSIMISNLDTFEQSNINKIPLKFKIWIVTLDLNCILSNGSQTLYLKIKGNSCRNKRILPTVTLSDEINSMIKYNHIDKWFITCNNNKEFAIHRFIQK